MVASLVFGVLLTSCNLTYRSTKPEVACFNNLRQIDAAEQAWAVENHRTTNDMPTWADLQGYLRSTNMTCPAGGTYSLARIGDPPICSVPEHAALYRKDRPQPWLPKHALDALPEDLGSLQEATGFRDWESVQGYSRALTHYRQLRFDEDSNVFISQTGTKPGQVDVVEAILMPLDRDSGKRAEFALYDPKSGQRIVHYPDSIKFNILGIAGGSRNSAPVLCMACHLERYPLVAVVPWSQALENDLKRSRATQGIRVDLMAPLPNDEAARNRMTALNKIMQDRFPDQILDIRNWLAIRTQHGTEPQH
jgi:hypothetical protein